MVAGDKAALIALVGGKVGKPVCKWYGLGLGFFQTSQEVQPCRGRLDQEFPRPLEGLHTMAMVPLTSPAIRRRLDGWRAARPSSSTTSTSPGQASVPRRNKRRTEIHTARTGPPAGRFAGRVPSRAHRDFALSRSEEHTSELQSLR